MKRLNKHQEYDKNVNPEWSSTVRGGKDESGDRGKIL